MPAIKCRYCEDYKNVGAKTSSETNAYFMSVWRPEIHSRWFSDCDKYLWVGAQKPMSLPHIIAEFIAVFNHVRHFDIKYNYPI